MICFFFILKLLIGQGKIYIYFGGGYLHPNKRSCSLRSWRITLPPPFLQVPLEAKKKIVFPKNYKFKSTFINNSFNPNLYRERGEGNNTPASPPLPPFLKNLWGLDLKDKEKSSIVVFANVVNISIVILTARCEVCAKNEKPTPL